MNAVGNEGEGLWWKNHFVGEVTETGGWQFFQYQGEVKSWELKTLYQVEKEPIITLQINP